MRIGADYEVAAHALIAGSVATIAFSRTVHRSRTGSPYRRFAFVMGDARLGGGAFYRDGHLAFTLPPVEPHPVGTTVRFRADAEGVPLPGSGTIRMPGRAEEALTPLPTAA